MCSQGWALDVQMSAIGANQLGSSRLATLSTTTSGMRELPATSGEPHSGQNPRRAVCPASPRTTWYLGSPFRRAKAAAGTATTEDAPPPLARWQSRQWQFSIATGAAEHSYLIAPHAQPPVNDSGTDTPSGEDRASAF
jgi:hypothetical protein